MSWAWMEQKRRGMLLAGCWRCLVMLASLDLDALDLLVFILVGPHKGVLLMLPGFCSGLWDDKETSAGICRAQKHCHLLTRMGTQPWTLPCRWSPSANGRGAGCQMPPSLG